MPDIKEWIEVHKAAAEAATAAGDKDRAAAIEADVAYFEGLADGEAEVAAEAPAPVETAVAAPVPEAAVAAPVEEAAISAPAPETSSVQV